MEILLSPLRKSLSLYDVSVDENVPPTVINNDGISTKLRRTAADGCPHNIPNIIRPIPPIIPINVEISNVIYLPCLILVDCY